MPTCSLCGDIQAIQCVAIFYERLKDKEYCGCCARKINSFSHLNWPLRRCLWPDSIYNLAPSVLQPIVLSPLHANGRKFQTIQISPFLIWAMQQSSFNIGTLRNFTDSFFKCIDRCCHMTTGSPSHVLPLSLQWFGESQNHER